MENGFIADAINSKDILISNSYATGNVTASASGVAGGLIGRNAVNPVSIARSYYAATLSGGTRGGIYGANTYKQVISFQHNKSLVVDGVVGAKTWNTLLK